MEFLSIEELKKRDGLRLILVAGAPSPWGQAAKAMFEHCAAMPRIDVDSISRAQLQIAVETITRLTNAKNGWISHEDMRAAIGAALNA